MADTLRRIAMLLLLAASLAGCGQKGQLYLPDAARRGRDAPAETPPASESTEAPNSPQTVDSQPAAPRARSRSHGARNRTEDAEERKRRARRRRPDNADA